MARQNKTKASDKTETKTTEETPVTEETKTEDTPVDLTAFQGAVTEALTEADESTGELPEAAVAKVNEQYRALEGQKPKGAARTFLEEQMLEAVGNLDAVKARSYSDLKAKLTAGGGGSKSEKAPADPTAAYVQQVAALRLAYTLKVDSKPEAVAEGWEAKVDEVLSETAEQVEAYKAWQTAEVPEGEEKPDAPEVSPVVRQAFKLSTGKGGGRVGGGNASGVRRDTGKHIASAFAEVEVGTFLTIAEIAKHKSAEYGDSTPSQGAISARLFPTTTVEGVEPVEKAAIDGKNPKGARKVA